MRELEKFTKKSMRSGNAFFKENFKEFSYDDTFFLHKPCMKEYWVRFDAKISCGE